MAFLLQYASAIAALLAALFWFWSAAMRVPNQTIRLWIGDKPGGPTPNQLALARQSKLSAIAAAFAGLSALFQVGATYEQQLPQAPMSQVRSTP